MLLEALAANRALGLLPRFIGLGAPGLVAVYGPAAGLNFKLWRVRRKSSGSDPVLRAVVSNNEAPFRWLPSSQSRVGGA